MEAARKMQLASEASETSGRRQQGGADNSRVVAGGGGEHGPLTHEKVNVHSTRNIKMRQHMCVKHALPKTRLTNAILYENSSQERHLEMKLADLQHSRLRTSNALDISRRAFTAQQDRKRQKWHREDKTRVASMNLPVFTELGKREMSGIGGGVGVVAERRPSMTIIYRLASDGARAETPGAERRAVLPMMKIKRERTEIISHRDRVFVTKLPTVVEIDQRLLGIHNSYCGQSLMNRGVPSRDERFKRLHRLLSPAFLKPRDDYPTENVFCNSRALKYKHLLSAERADPLTSRPEGKAVIASRRHPVTLRMPLLRRHGDGSHLVMSD